MYTQGRLFGRYHVFCLSLIGNAPRLSLRYPLWILRPYMHLPERDLLSSEVGRRLEQELVYKIMEVAPLCRHRALHSHFFFVFWSVWRLPSKHPLVLSKANILMVSHNTVASSTPVSKINSLHLRWWLPSRTLTKSSIQRALGNFPHLTFPTSRSSYPIKKHSLTVI